MAEPTSATTTQGPKVGSEEWVKQTLSSKASQIEAIEGTLDDPQGDEPKAGAVDEATTETTTAVSAPNWREVPIPDDDAEVPQHFRGKTTGEFYRGYKELERTWNADREKMRQMEAKLAAKETLEEFLKEAQGTRQQQPSSPLDPYREAGLDLETDPVLNPTKFFPKQEEVVLSKAKQLFDQELGRYKQEQEAKAQLDAERNATMAALNSVAQKRNISQQEMDSKIGFLLFETSRLHGKDGLFDPEKMLAVYDRTFGPPREAAAVPRPPDPPGVKKPAAIESAKPAGPQLKSFQREAMMAAAEQLKRAGFGNIDTERFAARYAANLKRMKE